MDRHGPAGQRAPADRVVSGASLVVDGLRVEFPTPGGVVRAVDGVSFALAPGERLGLVGESGSGKSTTVLALLRMIRPPGRIAAGTVRLGDRDLLALDARAMRAARFAEISLVPQGAMNALNPVLRVRDQIADVMRAHGIDDSDAAIDARIGALLESVGLAREVARLHPHQLSGGMKQRVCIAMSVALQPSVVLADEPTSALDVVVQKQVLATLATVQQRIGASIILVGHDMGLMAQFVHRLGVMYAGRLVELGPVREIFARPRHPYTRALIASLPSLARRGEFRGIPGIAPSLLAPPPGCAFHPRCAQAVERCRRDAPVDRAAGDGHRAACHLVAEDGLAPAD
ncbi:MAG: ABC transporter ATP-binding protein [Alphaproteobacteria bacterium]|nr:ABC transporter ATP-binding protein [Alphaproteobacteria bacterium]